MVTTLSDTKPVAMKKHRCEWCGECIDVGEKHQRIVQMFDGDFQCYRLHFECHHMMLCMHSENSSSFDDDVFEPYRNRRGKKPEEIVAARLRGDSEWRY